MPPVIGAILGLIVLFKPRCADRSTLSELAELAADPTRWGKCHDLFSRIRNKTLSAERTGDQLLEAQFLFEEACAKALYNLSRAAGPFDRDSPFNIVPNAFILARRLNISDSEVVRTIIP